MAAMKKARLFALSTAFLIGRALSPSPAQAAALYASLEGVSGQAGSVAVIDPGNFSLVGLLPALPSLLSATASSLALPGDCGTSILLLPADATASRPEALVIAGPGPVLSLWDPLSNENVSSLSLTARPLSLIYDAQANAAARPSATPTPSPVPGLAPPPSPMSVLHGSISGRLLSIDDHQPLLDLDAVSVVAINRRGDSVAGSVDAEGKWQVKDLAWGSYSIVVQAKGFQKLSRAKVLLTGSKLENVDLELIKEP
jgi:hypothetical protein